MKSITYFFFWGICLPFSCQSQPWGPIIKSLGIRLATQTTHSVYDSLHFLVTEHYPQLTREERSRVRNTLEGKAEWPTEKLCTAKEKGTKITIKGRLLNEHGQPVPTAKLYIFHADNSGYYAPSDSTLKTMNEGDPRIFGFLTTDNSGNYAFQTIRPASYPNKYNGRTIPQHVHINVTAAGYKARNIQMAFEDDPAMKDPYWHEWAKQQNYPVVKLQSGKDGRLYGTCELILTTTGH
jgi:protocatechuate 3,4-dioxygenase beta subunit